MMLGFTRRPCNCPWSVPIIRETLWRESHTNRPARTDRRPVRREFRLVIPLEFELVGVATKILGFGLMRSSKVVPSKIPDPLGSPAIDAIGVGRENGRWDGGGKGGGRREWKKVKGGTGTVRLAPTPRSQYRGRMGRVQVGRLGGARWGSC